MRKWIKMQLSKDSFSTKNFLVTVVPQILLQYLKVFNYHELHTLQQCQTFKAE